MVHFAVLTTVLLQSRMSVACALPHRPEGHRARPLPRPIGRGTPDLSAGRANPRRAIGSYGPCSLPLYEAAAGDFATAQMAALTAEMDTRHLRHLDLELMAGR